ncbi:hypothetical protein [Methanosarcina barkeri]|uniref:Uncharacterized protein n=1 Tax=Methanosarcina barkeri 227 TaxID=1434106 RepID=A0A0E3R0U7_METBA|nr:hypothetical protein [Methanosarcina barkeri]AKB56925.1 hypothetical protein MSBR2_0409 [Methanosarcina barkeri 227]
MIKVEINIQSRVCQGDIYKNIEYIESIYENDEEEEGVIEISKIIFPYVIVLTQDCDLSQDFSFRDKSESKDEELCTLAQDAKSENKFKSDDDKIMLSVLVAPLYNVENVYLGVHLEKLNKKMQIINKNKTPGNNLRTNSNPRYHYLEFPNDVQLVPSVIDFKHYFSVDVNYLYKVKNTKFVCKVSELYREDISHRFASFLSRIGLP